jgi:hypothetical protein
MENRVRCQRLCGPRFLPKRRDSAAAASRSEAAETECLTPSPYGWAREEVNAVFTRELVEQSDGILPVWHEVSRDQVYEYSPSLANRFAIKLESRG